MILTTFKILQNKINFHFNYDNFLKICCDLIIDNSENIKDSDGLTSFFSIVEYLFEKGYLVRNQHFKIEKTDTIKLRLNRKEHKDWVNIEGKEILFFRLKPIHHEYTRECSHRDGTQIINQNTIREYFKNRKWYIGNVKSTTFEQDPKGNSCYAFDYEMMREKGILSLENAN